MIKLITGNKGTGKTKILVDMAVKAAGTSNGSVVCIEKEPKLTFDLPSSVRLIETCNPGIDGYCEFYGFVTGVLMSNYDITDLFIDSTLKIGGKDLDKLASFLDRLNAFVGSREVNIVFTVSADPAELPESAKAYLA